MLAQRRRCGWRSLERGRFNNWLRCCSEGNPQGFGVTVQRGLLETVFAIAVQGDGDRLQQFSFTDLAPALTRPDSPGSKSRAGAR